MPSASVPSKARCKHVVGGLVVDLPRVMNRPLPAVATVQQFSHDAGMKNSGRRCSQLASFIRRGVFHGGKYFRKIRPA